MLGSKEQYLLHGSIFIIKEKNHQAMSQGTQNLFSSQH